MDAAGHCKRDVLGQDVREMYIRVGRVETREMYIRKISYAAKMTCRQGSANSCVYICKRKDVRMYNSRLAFTQ
jgi:hypothetical protein